MTTQEKMDALAAIQPLLDDPQVLEIMIDGYERIYVERKGKFEDEPSPFQDEAQLMQLVEAIAQSSGLALNNVRPLFDARLPDGSRANIVLPPVSLVGPALTIRKFEEDPLTIEDLLRWGAWNEAIVTFIQASVQSRLNIAVAGGIGSGKTTVLNLVAGMIPDNERIITVERTAELQLKQKRLIRLESRLPDIGGQGEVTVQDLLLNAMKMRPDRIILGEALGSEVLEMLQAMNTGYDGSLLSIHASGVLDVLSRLEMMATYGDTSLPLLMIRQMMASGLDLILYHARLQDGSRKMLKVAEVTGMQGDTVSVQDIFEFRQTGLKDGRISGHFTATGQIPKHLDRIRAAGIELPLSMFTPS